MIFLTPIVTAQDLITSERVKAEMSEAQRAELRTELFDTLEEIENGDFEFGDAIYIPRATGNDGNEYEEVEIAITVSFRMNDVFYVGNEAFVVDFALARETHTKLAE